MPTTWGPPAPRPPDRRGTRRRGIGPLVILVLLGIVAAIAVALVQATEDDTATSGETGAPKLTKETAPPTTTIPRVTQAPLLSEYCNAPGTKWPEVPAHVPGEPDRTQVRVMGGGVNTAADSKSQPQPIDSGNSLGGSTVISPQTDGTFTDDPSVLERTRTVTCVTFVATETTGETCEYNANQFGGLSYVSLNVAKNRYAVTVYELRSGGILHKGEIQTRASGCPAYALTNEGSGYVAYGVTNQDILSWLNSHFVGGTPA